ncbi:ATP-binding protein [Microbacterium sediminicola]|uniref:Sensor-like histidine kinase SenX3 n=1 Tax=Microbacterium sediminicola TaxID=415210 RepID=A0ABP4UM57_9MICO
MTRLRTRLVLSHLIVALLGGVATFVVVLILAPLIFDRQMGMGTGTGSMGNGSGSGTRQQLLTDVTIAVSQALLVGLVVGVLAATAAGIFLATRLSRPLREMSEATQRIAEGDYDVRVVAPREQELAALADDVNTLGRALAETEKRRTRLLGEVAHEMRTPLTVIDGYVEGMIDGILPTESEQLAKVSDEVRRLRRLSDDLSALSRTEEGRLGLAEVPIELGMLVTAVAERLRPQAEDADIHLTVTVADDPVPVLVDPDRIGQVITNLIGNAVRATGEGGSISVDVATRGARAEITVADTGEGLAEADLDRIFERFYRVPGRRGGASGSGVGLTIARGIVRAHGGELMAESDGPGRGAAFVIGLPLHDGAGQDRGS